MSDVGIVLGDDVHHIAPRATVFSGIIRAADLKLKDILLSHGGRHAAAIVRFAAIPFTVLPRPLLP